MHFFMKGPALSDQADFFPAIRKLAQYEVWCNRLSLDHAAKLDTDDLYREFGFGFGTIHMTLFHTLQVFHRWSNCVGPTIAIPRSMGYNRKTKLATFVERHEELAQAFFDAIDRSHDQGLLHQDRRIHQVFHLVTHGTHHRTQFITMLRLLGVEPPFEPGDFGGWSNVAG